jgi:1,5-anhydro-D-fructose reductase (1,5-anhydro-D-mannitol-forming)
MSLGIALLGTGSIADHAFAPAVQATDGAQLVAVLSRDQRRGEAFAQRHAIPAVYDDLAALLRSPQVDAVIVATPDATHEPQVIAAAQAGKHILCEKPMTTTVAGCQRMAEVIQASGMTFAMGYTWRFNAGARTIKALLEAGAIGPVRYARGFLSTQAQDPAGWRAQQAEARYWALSGVGTHLIDLWRWYFGEPASVGGGLLSPVHHSVNDELAALVLLYPDRLLAELAVTAVFQGANRVEIYGEAGHIIGEGLSGARPEGRITHNGQPVPFEPVNPFLGEVADFVAAVQQHRPPCATLEDGIRNVAIMEAAREGPMQMALAAPGVW